jgi:hypothetical protein
MPLSINASASCKVNFTLTEVNASESLSLGDAGSSSISYTYGTGVNKINNAISITGVLSSGGRTTIDLYSIPQTTFNTTQNVQFTGVKNITIHNLSTGLGYDFSIRSTGTNACTNLFNGGSGNLLVKPYSAFTYNDPFSGFVVSTGQRFVYLQDAGSGVNYKLLVLGMASG